MTKLFVSTKRASVLLLLLLSVTAHAKINFSGELTLDKRVLPAEDGVPIFPMFNKLLLKAKASQTNHFGAYASLDFRFYDFSIITDFDGATDPGKHQPYDLMLYEAYVEVFDMGLEGLDLRLGKQRIAWGTGDGLNPTDNLNPDDFSDITNFGEKVPTFAVNLGYSFFLGESELKLQYVWLPTVQPILMPRFIQLPISDAMFNADALMADLTAGMNEVGLAIFSGMELDPEQQVAFQSPPYDGEHSMHAVKLGGTVGIFDFSLSYFRGYDDIPAPFKIVPDMSGGGFDSSILTKFPELQVIGADTAFELFEVGFRAEVGFFFPEEVSLSISSDDEATQKAIKGLYEEGVVPSSQVLSDDTYIKYTIGLDYTFTWGTYINLQYAHGFTVERGNELHDYIMLRLEHTFINDQLKVSLGGGVITDGFQDLADNYAYMIMPELSFRFFDNVDIAVGGWIIEGEGDGFILAMDDFDQVYLRVKGMF